jgi:hypothetical protein
MGRHGLLVFIAAALVALVGPAAGEAAAPKVLILGSSVAGGTSSAEATEAAALGYDVEVATDAQWARKTAEQFGSYRAIILGDDSCDAFPPYAAIANAGVWGPRLDGNVVIIGTSPVFYGMFGAEGAAEMTRQAVAFAAASPSGTGGYVALGCDFHVRSEPKTPVPLLAGLGTFTVTGGQCVDMVHIVSDHPVVAGITDAMFGGWPCAPHAPFDLWPADFDVVAMAKGTGTEYTAPDGSVGNPFILVRGPQSADGGAIEIAQASAGELIGASHTIVATVRQGGTPQAGVDVRFDVTGANPAVGQTTTDSAGEARFTYSGWTAGLDQVVASYKATSGTTHASNALTVRWRADVPGAATPTCGGEFATIVALPGIATVGTAGSDVIVGSGGDDDIQGQGGDDVICAGGGDDTVRGGGGDDVVRGGAGHDLVSGAGGADVLTGASGNDRIKGGTDDDRLQGGAGDDGLSGGDGDDRLSGGQDDDSVLGGDGADRLLGGSGADLLRGGAGDDTLVDACDVVMPVACGP